MSFRIGIIGAGWYGCHLALSFRSLGFSIKVFERQERPLHEASGNNQFRLHLGFHYVRHHLTRVQSRDGFLRFIERYPLLSAPVERNIYAVPDRDSLVDFATYKLVMASSGIDFVEMPEVPSLLRGVSGAMLTQERVLLVSRARNYFTERLGSSLNLGHEVHDIEHRANDILLDGEPFDYVIDATWGYKSQIPGEIFYEPTILLYYETSQSFPAITLVDGALCSVYPTEDPSIFTLSSVTHTPLGTYTSGSAARARLETLRSEEIAAKRSSMEEQILRYVPGFRDIFRFVGVQLAVKTKPVGRVDDRACHVHKDGRLFIVMSGKIDTIFVASERIISYIEAENVLSWKPTDQNLRESIKPAGMFSL